MTKQNRELDQVLRTTSPVLLDFDGPVTHLFVEGRNMGVANRMRKVLTQAQIQAPSEIWKTYDPLVILRWAPLQLPRDLAIAVEQACIAGELFAARHTSLTPGAAELLIACHEVGRPVVVVSNNASDAIEAFLTKHELRPLVQAIVARPFGHPEKMKPNVDPINRALTIVMRPAVNCVLIGDSVSDIEVAKKTGVQTIGYAKNQARGRELKEAGADSLIADMRDLTHPIRETTRSGLSE